MSESGDGLREVELRILAPELEKRYGLPRYATDGAAGLDLYACIAEPSEIAPGATLVVNSGIAISIGDPAYMAVVVPRSGMGAKRGIVLANLVGVIDSDYQGEIRIALWNRGAETVVIEPGDRICQLLFVPVVRPKLRVVDEFSTDTRRGAGGFGSTGVKP